MRMGMRSIKRNILCGSFAAALAMLLMNPAITGENPESGQATVEKLFRDINGGPVIPSDANRIFIPFFENRTEREGLPEKLRIRISESISKDRRLAVVDSGQKSDVFLEGTITSFQIQNIAFNSLGVVEKKRMRVTASIKLTRTSSGSVIFMESGIQSFMEYSDTVPPITSEARVFDEVIDELAERIRAKTISGWYTELMTPVEKGKSR